MRLRTNFSLANLFDQIIVVSGGVMMERVGETLKPINNYASDRVDFYNINRNTWHAGPFLN